MQADFDMFKPHTNLSPNYLVVRLRNNNIDAIVTDLLISGLTVTYGNEECTTIYLQPMKKSQIKLHAKVRDYIIKDKERLSFYVVSTLVFNDSDEMKRRFP